MVDKFARPSAAPPHSLSASVSENAWLTVEFETLAVAPLTIETWLQTSLHLEFPD